MNLAITLAPFGTIHVSAFGLVALVVVAILASRGRRR